MHTRALFEVTAEEHGRRSTVRVTSKDVRVLYLLLLGVALVIGRFVLSRSRRDVIETPPLSDGAPPPKTNTEALDERVRDLLRRDRRLEAVQLYRRSTGKDLRDAHFAVKAIADAMPPVAPAPAPPAGSVEEALAEGRVIEAIKRYRALHGVDLQTAKRAIDALRKE